MSKNDFYMVLPSNSCPLIHPNNTSSYFKIELQTGITLQGDWEVALTEFSIFNQSLISMFNKRLEYRPKDIETRTYQVLAHSQDNIELLPTNEMRPINIKMSFADNITTISCEITPYTVEFENIESAKRYGFRQVVNVSDKVRMYSPELRTEMSGGLDLQNQIRVKTDSMNAPYIVIQFTEVVTLTSLDDLCKYILKNASQVFKSIGIQNDKLEFVFQDDIASVIFDETLSNLLMLSQTQWDYSFSVHSDQIRVFDKSNYEIYVYTDLIEPIIVGDTYAPLLKTIWIEKKHVSDRVTHFSVDRPMYLPVSTNRINNVEFNLRHDSGELIRFLPNTKSCLTVHFRKRK